MERVPVCVFAKPPAPGRCKTRLGRTLGDDAAARVAVALLRDVWDVVTSRPWALPILATTDVTDRGFGLGEAIARWDQGDGDLGARVERVLRRGVGDGGAAIALGADTAGLDADLLDRARDALADGRAVLGPSEDGGFYLLGVPRCPEGLLEGLPWSQPDTFARTRARVASILGDPVLLPARFDVDEEDDLRRLAARADAGALPRGRTWALARALAVAGPR